MIVDPMPFAGTSTQANLANFYSTDFAPGASTRQEKPVSQESLSGTVSNVLRISHTNTKENPGLVTTRSLIRLDVKYQGDDGDGNPAFSPRTASVYLVCRSPMG